MTRKVLVTGASRGIGKAIAAKFQEHGYEAVTPSRQELDLSNDKSIESFVRLHKKEYFDVIVNNAGCNDVHAIEQVTDEELTNMMQVNLIAPIKLLRGLVGAMREQHYGKM